LKVSIYVEGGGDRKDLKIKCREGFRKLFERAGFKGRMPVIIACGGRSAAHDKFSIGMKEADDDEMPMLLIDAEGPIPDEETVWQYLKRQANFDKPEDANDDHAHLMVQLMESWFLADRPWLGAYFGEGFTPGSLPNEQNIEKIGKQRVLSSLQTASRNTKTKGEYSKSQHSFDILGGLDPRKVRAASQYAERFFSMVDDYTNQ
jgi:hypothetical protein